MSRLDLRIRAVTDPDDPILDGALAIYEDSIAEAERKPSQMLRSLASSPDYRFLVAVQGEEAVGFMLLFIGESAALVEYLAVAAEARGGGIGARLFDQARQDAAPGVLLVEVESYLEAAVDREMQARRIAFYRRLGCRRVEGLDYLLPLCAAGEAHPMSLLVQGYEESCVPRTMAETWLREIYPRVYGQAGDDPRISLMLAALPASVALI